MPGSDAVTALEAVLGRGQSCLIEGNGVLSWGTDTEQAYLRMELVEHLCKIAQEAMPLGGVKVLDRSMIEVLTRKHIAGGLAAPQIASQGGIERNDHLSTQVEQRLAQHPTLVSQSVLSQVVAEVTKVTLAELQQEK